MHACMHVCVCIECVGEVHVCVQIRERGQEGSSCLAGCRSDVQCSYTVHVYSTVFILVLISGSKETCIVSVLRGNAFCITVSFELRVKEQASFVFRTYGGVKVHHSQ